MSHEATLQPVRDVRGYDLGWCAECDCGWTSDLTDSSGRAFFAWQEHMTTTRGK